MLKPKPARLLSLLNAYGAGGDKTPFIPFAGVTSIPNEGNLNSENFNERALALAGYRAVGTRIVRLDILNRLSLMIRQAQDQFAKIPGTDTRGRPFQIMQEMLSLLGGTYEDTQKVLTALGYQSETREDLPDLPKPEESSPEEAEAAPKTESGEKGKSEASPDQTPSADEKTTEAAPENSKPAEAPKPKKTSGRNDLSLYNNRVQGDDGSVTEIANKEVWMIAARGQKGFKPKGGHSQNKKPRHKGGKGKPKAVYSSGRADGSASKGKASIKNSPFAALAALNIDESSKNGKKEKKDSGTKKKPESKKDSKES
tara:strand:- start:1284 stop:2222 length:939 start_codon:yes stop_codon:yes gene_type:complete